MNILSSYQQKILLLIIFIIIFFILIFFTANKLKYTTKQCYDNNVIKKSPNMIGFIFTRHVNSKETNEYWIESYKKIRQFYPQNFIMIIDDNSNYKYITQPETLHLTNCFIIQSEFPQSGELNSYYYFNKYNIFDKAVIIHDSTFIQTHINFDQITDIKYLWHFHHDWDNQQDEKNIIELAIKNKKEVLLQYDKKDLWYGTFGIQAVITRDFLNKLIERFNIFNLLKHVNTRKQRMAIERIFGLLCSIQKPELYDEPSLFGIIHDYCKWGYTYQDYKNNLSNLPIIKVWTGR
jgi:hypothetical protein